MSSRQPLAAALRPQRLEDFVGQRHLVGDDAPIAAMLRQRELISCIFWGPPGVGKTTLARLMAAACDYHYATLSAVSAGVGDIRAIIAEAEQKREQGQRTLVFIDEVHRFNKAQQDALLPRVEDGLLTLIGATTENPSFEINKALLSRVQVYCLNVLSEDELEQVLQRAVAGDERVGALGLKPAQCRLLMAAGDGDARRMLGHLEQLVLQCEGRTCTDDDLQAVLQGQYRRFDKAGEDFYDIISALHKSVRGSNPDAALYWCQRMLDGGADPLYVGRRLVRMASEDIGNADPRALQVSLNACDAYHRLGTPEGELALLQAAVYLACAPKSNAVYRAAGRVGRRIAETGSLAVPKHLRNAPTALMRDLGYGKGYRYAHDEEQGYTAGEQYLPDELQNERFYQPGDDGLERQIAERLARLRALDRDAGRRR